MKNTQKTAAKSAVLEVREGRYHLVVDGKSVFDSANRYYCKSKAEILAPGIKVVDKTGAAVKQAGGSNLERLAEDNPALAFPINKRFEFVQDLVEMVATKKCASAIITGEGGLGKSHTVLATLRKAGLKEIQTLDLGTNVVGKTFVVIKGFSTAKGLYRALYENKNGLIVFDDCDSVLQDSDALQLLKGALDSYDERWITWNTSSMADSLPRSFKFSGGVIFISNLSQTKIDQAVRTRAMCIDLSMSADQKITRMEHIVKSDDFLPEIDAAHKADALKLLKEFKDEARELSLRSLISVARIRANKSGSEWRDLAVYMLVN